MKVKVIGKYGRYCPCGEGTNCYLIQSDNGKNILIDCGSGALSLLQKHISITQIDMIIITHLHFDHVCDLGVLQYAFSYLKAKQIPLYLPKTPNNMFEIFTSACFDVKIIDESIELCVDNIKFSFAKSPHPVETYAVIMQEKGKKIVYTSDCLDAVSLQSNTLGADVVIGDACILEKDYKTAAPHISVRTLCEVVPKDAKLYLAHLTFGDEDQILKEGLKYHKNTELVHDFDI